MKFIFTQWKHNDGYQSNWLRRITRESKTQLICDVQRSLLLSDKHKKMYDSGQEYMMGVFPMWAKRFVVKNGELKERITHLHNTDGIRAAILLSDDFSALRCTHKYEDLFGVDIRSLFAEDSITLKYANHCFSVYSERGCIDADDFFTLTTELVEPTDNLYGGICIHLNNLFKVPVHVIDTTLIRINTIHDTSIYNCGVRYHINHHGGDMPVITSKQNRENKTITFWLFEDKVVFKTEDGIDTW